MTKVDAFLVVYPKIVKHTWESLRHRAILLDEKMIVLYIDL